MELDKVPVIKIPDFKVDLNAMHALPYETKIKVIDKVTAKGDPQPEVEVTISRRFDNSLNILSFVEQDLEIAVEQAKKGVKVLMSLGGQQ